MAVTPITVTGNDTVFANLVTALTAFNTTYAGVQNLNVEIYTRTVAAVTTYYWSFTAYAAA